MNEHLHHAATAAGAAYDAEAPENLSTFFQRLLSADFMPHGHCYYWKPEIVWLHVVSDALIALAYYSIPLMLIYFVRKRKDMPFHWIFLLFAGFIFWCGTTHLMAIYTLWNPVYRLDGVVKALTAGISVYTAIVLYPLIPKALAMRTPERFLTEMKEQVDDRTRRLKNVNQELERFAYVASHDLQEPLRMVTVFCQLLERDFGPELQDPKAKEYLAEIIGGSKRMKSLISDLLEYSRAGVYDAAFETVDLNTICKTVQKSLRSEIDKYRIEITVDKLPEVQGNPVDLERLFQNLLSNALKYSQPGKFVRVRITSEEDGEGWKISVKDNGIGIAKEHFDKIFDLFQRLHSRADYPGTGLGLAICKRVVEQHHGRIWVESELGNGTTFHVWLPKRSVAGS